MYPNNAHYSWTITVEGDSYVQIRFLDLDIEDLYDCYYDQLTVRLDVMAHTAEIAPTCVHNKTALWTDDKIQTRDVCSLCWGS